MTNEGLVFAYLLDGGTGRALSAEELNIRPPTGGFVWMHFHMEHPATKTWLSAESGLEEIVQEAMLADETRPRSTVFDDGLLLNLRGINFNPGSDPEDMVSIRIWFEPDRVVSVYRRPLLAVEDLKRGIAGGQGPDSVGTLLVALGQALTERMAGIITDLDDAVDELESDIIVSHSHELRRRLNELRRQAIALRRYIGPNREAIAQLVTEGPLWLEPEHKQRLHELSDRITRYIEGLDNARERAAIIQDELASLISEAMNRNTYLLSIIAAIFLPLSLITGLLGINVAGIPGEKWIWAFTTVCAGLVALAVVEIWYLRRRKWL